MNIILYTIDCPKCKVLEAKLNKKGIQFKTEKDESIINNVCKEFQINSLPILKINNNFYNFSEAIKWVGEQSC